MLNSCSGSRQPRLMTIKAVIGKESLHDEADKEEVHQSSFGN